MRESLLVLAACVAGYTLALLQVSADADRSANPPDAPTCGCTCVVQGCDQADGGAP